MRPIARRDFVRDSALLAAAVSVGVGCGDSGTNTATGIRTTGRNASGEETDESLAGEVAADALADDTAVNPVLEETVVADVASPSLQDRLAVVIGSGFAGSVAALRLAQAGIPTIVLERGQEWPVDEPNGIPVNYDDRRTTWFGEVDGLSGLSAVTPYAGMLERVSGDTLDAVGAACVGGGSLVYGGVLFQPPRDIFDAVFPSISYDEMDQLYYPRVIETIGASPLPDDVLASDPYAAHRAFLKDAAAAGFETVRPNASFDWDVVRQELRGELPPAAITSDYLFGCRSGAKLSTDRNYLRQAIDSGFAQVRSLCEVETIREDSRGYTISYRRINAEGDVLDRVEVSADYLFMAAGSLNTTKLLVDSQNNGGLSAANAQIGKHWGTNGDQLMIETRAEPFPGQQGGPACIGAVDRGTPGYPVVYEHSPAKFKELQIQLTMSVPDELGELGYDAEGNWSVRWPDDTNSPSARARAASFDRLVAATGGENSGGGTGSIWHPLGGAVMGQACDDLGRLNGYNNLFVIDSALMPGSTACANPALTIAANAERIMATLIPQLT